MQLPAKYSKTFKIVYGVVFPIIVAVLLLGVASLNSRPLVFGSIIYDLVIRGFLAIWFCGLYIRLSRIDTFSYYPNKKWTKADVSPEGIIYYRGMSVLFGVACGVMTWWIIQWFYPTITNCAELISVANFLIIVFPMVTHYWVFKL